MIPTLVRTWAPRGQTPVHRHWYRRDKVSVISGISLSPRRCRLGLYYRLFPHNIRRLDVCEFLRHLMRHLKGPLIALLDNSRTHKGDPIGMLRCKHRRLRVEYFPAYAPELNPDEAVWSLAKRSIANSRPDTIDQLAEQVMNALDEIRRSQRKLRSCIDQSPLPLFLP